jgi:hypothetical protein
MARLHVDDLSFADNGRTAVLKARRHEGGEGAGG